MSDVVHVRFRRGQYDAALRWLHLGAWGLTSIPTNRTKLHGPDEVAHRIALSGLGHTFDEMIGGGCIICGANRWGHDGRPLAPCPPPRTREQIEAERDAATAVLQGAFAKRVVRRS